MRLKNAQSLRTYEEHTEAEERRGTFILDNAPKSYKQFVSRVLFVSATSPAAVLCMYNFDFNFQLLFIILVLSSVPSRLAVN